MDPVIPHDAVPVDVNFFDGKVALRIGGHGQGQGRVALLKPKEARVPAYVLLREAEKSGAD